MDDPKPRKPCLHCILVDAMDRYNEDQHLRTGNPVNVLLNIADLMACAAELIAMYDDRNDRRMASKHAISELTRLTKQRRAAGRYPGGAGAEVIKRTAH